MFEFSPQIVDIDAHCRVFLRIERRVFPEDLSTYRTLFGSPAGDRFLYEVLQEFPIPVRVSEFGTFKDRVEGSPYLFLIHDAGIRVFQTVIYPLILRCQRFLSCVIPTCFPSLAELEEWRIVDVAELFLHQSI